jgi:hypothetical protein
MALCCASVADLDDATKPNQTTARRLNVWSLVAAAPCALPQMAEPRGRAPWSILLIYIPRGTWFYFPMLELPGGLLGT